MSPMNSKKIITFLTEKDNKKLKFDIDISENTFFQTDLYNFIFSTPNEYWIKKSDMIHIINISNYDILQRCILTAWRNFIPIILNANILIKYLDNFNTIRLQNNLQDLINKIDILIFNDKKEYDFFINKNYKYNSTIISTQLYNTNSYNFSFNSILNNNKINTINAELLNIYNTIFIKNNSQIQEKLNKKSDQTIYLDVSMLCGSPHYNGVPHFLMQCVYQLKELYKDRLNYVIYKNDTKSFYVCETNDFLNILAQFNGVCKLPLPKHGQEELKPGSKMIILGGSWGGLPGYIEYLQKLSYDIKLEIYLYVADVLKDKFPFSIKCIGIKDNKLLCNVSKAVHQIVTNSNSSVKDIVNVLNSRNFSIPPITILPRGVNIVKNSSILQKYPKIFNKLPQGTPYILIVGTLIYRKNYLLAYNIFRRLLEKFDPSTIPHLICVGHAVQGNIVSELLQEDPIVNTHIHIYSDASDEDLDMLYKNCLFTIYPSFYEGFGVPIAESLSYGKVCIASNTSSMPEVAPQHADLLDPLDFISWYNRICGYIFDYEKLKKREKEIADFTPHHYGEASSKLYEIMEKKVARSIQLPILSLGDVIKFTGDKSFIEPDISGLGCFFKENGLVLNGLDSEIQFRISNRQHSALHLDCLVNSPKTGLVPVEILINGQLYLKQNLRNGIQSLTLNLPFEAESNPGQFTEIHIIFSDPSAPFAKWGDNTEIGIIIQKASLELWRPTRREDLLEILDVLVDNGAALFRGVLRERPDILSYLPISQESAAFQILLWSWQYGRYENIALSGAALKLHDALVRLHSMPAPQAFIPSYTGLIHALWLVRPDLKFSPETKQGQEALVYWFNNYALNEYGFRLDDSGKLEFSLSGQSPITRNRMLEISTVSANITDRKQSFLDYTSLKRCAGFHPLFQFSGQEPQLLNPSSQLVTYSQFEEGVSYQRCAEMGMERLTHRKQWEHIYILQALIKSGVLKQDAMGIGFDSLSNPLPSALAARGANITIALNPLTKISLNDFWRADLISRTDFEQKISGTSLNLTELCNQSQGFFDFVWSGSVAHLNTINNGLTFIRDTIKLLKPGGIAVHVIELNISDLEETYNTASVSYFRKKDIEKMMRDKDFEIMPINWSCGNAMEDKLVDLKAHLSRPHLKLLSNGFVHTSLGLILRKRGK